MKQLDNIYNNLYDLIKNRNTHREAFVLCTLTYMEALASVEAVKINLDQEKKKKVASTFDLLNKNYKELNWTKDS